MSLVWVIFYPQSHHSAKCVAVGALQSMQLSQWVRCYSAKFATVDVLLFCKVCCYGCAVILQSMQLWVRCYFAKYATVGVLLFCMSQTWRNLWLKRFKQEQEQQTSNKSDREECSSKLFSFIICKLFKSNSLNGNLKEIEL